MPATVEKTRVMVNGLSPDKEKGRMARAVATAIQRSDDFILHNTALGGPSLENVEKQDRNVTIEGTKVQIYSPREGDFYAVDSGFSSNGGLVIDATAPEAVLSNFFYYRCQGWNSVILTTGYDMTKVREMVKGSMINTVIAPFATEHVVALGEVLAVFAQTGGQLRGAQIKIEESQPGPDPKRPSFKAKTDPSGIAIELSKCFALMGIEGCPFYTNEILAHPEKYKGKFVMVRERYKQLAMGVPAEYLDDHNWIKYTITMEGRPAKLFELGGVLHEFLDNNPVFAPYKEESMFGADGMWVKRSSEDKTALLRVNLLSRHIDFGRVETELEIVQKDNGRNASVRGALHALRFVRDAKGIGSAYSMTDVINKA